MAATSSGWWSTIGPMVGGFLALAGVGAKAWWDDKTKRQDRLLASAEKTQEGRKTAYTELLGHLEDLRVFMQRRQNVLEGPTGSHTLIGFVKENDAELKEKIQVLRTFIILHVFTISTEMEQIVADLLRVYDNNQDPEFGYPRHKGGGPPEGPEREFHDRFYPAACKAREEAEKQARAEVSTLSA